MYVGALRLSDHVDAATLAGGRTLESDAEMLDFMPQVTDHGSEASAQTCVRGALRARTWLAIAQGHRQSHE